MDRQYSAISISCLLRDLLIASRTRCVRVLGSYSRACNLLTPEGDLIALVSPEIGDGPHNIVVDAPFHHIDRNTIVSLDQSALRFGSFSVGLDEARSWEPYPDWAGLTGQLDQILACMPELSMLCFRQAPSNSLPALIEAERRDLPGSPGTPRPQSDMIVARLMNGASALRLGWGGDQGQLALGASQIAGLGWGLTPAGDDFLAGLMLWAWLAHPDPRSLCGDLLAAAAPYTTMLSICMLRAATAGACSVAWHQLLASLVSKDSLESAVNRVLAHGASSGADTLAGFLWIEELHRLLDFPTDRLYNGFA